MPQRQKPIDEMPKYVTPVIDMQDLEHNPTSQTRVPNTGMKIEPRIDIDDLHNFVQVDEDMLKALERVEKEIREEPPARYAIPIDVTNPFGR